MKLYIITTAAPPVLDGIGHYTASLVEALQREDASLEITVFAPDGLGKYDPINGAPVRTGFRTDDISTFQRLAEILRDEKPDWVCLQYQAFSYGKWGRNPVLPRVLKEARASVPGLRLATMVHETFVVPLSKSFITNLKLIVFGTWQKQQFRDLVRMSDLAFCSTERWIREYQPWFPNNTIHHLPVGSNMPLVPVEGGKAAAKKRLNIPEDHLVVGIFGTAHSSRMNDAIHLALDAVRRAGKKPFLLYIGPNAETFAASVPPDIPSLMDGPFPGEEVSQRLQAIDIYLALFIDGVAARRGSFIAAIQHSLATVGLIGGNTDSWLRDSDGFVGVVFNKDDIDQQQGDTTFDERFGEAVYGVAQDDALRHRYEVAARRLFDERFAWKKIAQTILQKMKDVK
jgi:glycosyltransferase involved in cell wall biosynthesis